MKVGRKTDELIMGQILQLALKQFGLSLHAQTNAFGPVQGPLDDLPKSLFAEKL